MSGLRQFALWKRMQSIYIHNSPDLLPKLRCLKMSGAVRQQAWHAPIIIIIRTTWVSCSSVCPSVCLWVSQSVSLPNRGIFPVVFGIPKFHKSRKIYTLHSLAAVECQLVYNTKKGTRRLSGIRAIFRESLFLDFMSEFSLCKCLQTIFSHDSNNLLSCEPT